MSGSPVEACPLCDRATIVERHCRADEERYRCFSCGHVFPTPRRRPRKGPNGKTTLHSLLELMDPDDLGGERA